MSRARILADYVSSGDELADKLAVTTAASTYAPIAGPIFTGTVAGVTATHVGLGNVANETRATILAGRYITATGGDVTIGTDGDYKYHVFTATKSGEADGFNVSSAGANSTVEYLVIAGGGAGVPFYDSHGTGGGGGAGGYRTGTDMSVSVQNYPITIGAGGTKSASFATGDSGDNSVFNGITATGGGGAGQSEGGTIAEMSGSVGGSGGGASGTGIASLGGVGIYNGSHTLGLVTHQGRDGGDAYYSGYNYGNGGGGGATAEGANGTAAGGGNGGAGVQNLIGTASNGATGYYCGGGGGASYTGAFGAGGQGGGGAASGSAGGDGTANTGGGGGGQGTGSFGSAGSGGSGIVIIRYKFQN